MSKAGMTIGLLEVNGKGRSYSHDSRLEEPWRSMFSFYS
jgi:hypothetical protein